MAAASTSLCPVASVLDILSEPARSTSVSFPCVTELAAWFMPSTDMVNIRCDLELYITNSHTIRLSIHADKSHDQI